MNRFTFPFAIAAVVLLAGCSAGSDQNPASSATAMAPPASVNAPPATADAGATPYASANAAASAHAVLASASDSNVQGRLSFMSTDQGVHITGRISGLEPGSKHGFHIHENGDCSAPDASSAGGHFNPTQQPHGQAGKGPHHAGDMDNQQADASGIITVDVVDHDVELGTGSDTDILGHAVIVHAKPDDYTSQPSGAAGARIACGVITAD